MNKFLTCKNRSIDIENVWYRNCQRQGIPCVIVRLRNKYAEVHWDCISIPVAADAKIDSHESELNKALLELFGRYSNKKSCYQFSAYVGEMDNFHPADAELAAAEVFELLSQALAA